jgi:hypothetical protein
VSFEKSFVSLKTVEMMDGLNAPVKVYPGGHDGGTKIIPPVSPGAMLIFVCD